jgi:hypothetical protein
MATRREQQRILRATKVQVINQLQTIDPAINATNLIDIRRSPDTTFTWEANFSSGFLTFGSIQQNINSYVQFDAQFLVTRLISAIDNTITPDMIEDMYISPSDSTRIEVSLRRRIS